LINRVVPPFVGVAVNVTLLPVQMEVELAAMETAGATELVVMVMALEVAVEVVVQLAFDVMITVTWSPLANALVVKVGELVPAFTPLTCH
jgi:hypothetical protein